jgi:hypothetical protein
MNRRPLFSITPSFYSNVWDAPNRLRLISEGQQEWSYNFVS